MSKRISRVNELIKEELSKIIQKEIDVSRETLITLTRVETSSDLEQANVYISVLPEKQEKIILQILDKNVYELQQKLNKRLRMRPIPRIQFKEEKETVEAGKIEEILEKLKNQ